MKTLSQHNQERERMREAFNRQKQRPNDIECPKCGRELVDIDPNVTLTCDPPQKAIKCLSCGYSGYRLA
jgi:transcription elongation factor Elf1